MKTFYVVVLSLAGVMLAGCGQNNWYATRAKLDSDIETMRAERLAKWQAQTDEDARCKAKGAPKIGMSKSEALASCAWGTVDHINTTQTARGISEQVVYRLGDHRSYVYVINGVVTALSY